MRPDTNLIAELSPEERAELGDLSPVAQGLAGYVAPRPTGVQTEALLAHLRPLVKARAVAQEALPAEPEPEFLPDEPLLAGPRGVRGWIALARSQTSLLEPPFWWASALLFALGLGTAIFADGRTVALSIALLSPVLAAAGVAYAFRPSARSLWEIERASPINPIELVYARLGLILSFNLALSVPLLALLAVVEPNLILWRLLVVWSGFMLGLTGLALYATVRWGALVGGAAPLILWAAVVGWQGRPGGRLLENLFTGGLIGLVNQSNGLLGVALGGLLLGVLLLRTGGQAALGEVRDGWN